MLIGELIEAMIKETYRYRCDGEMADRAKWVIIKGGVPGVYDLWYVLSYLEH